MTILEREIKSTEIQFTNHDQNSWELGNSVHVWKFPVIKTGFSLLTEPEKEFAGRFRFEADRDRYAVGRQALRFLLSKYLSVSPMKIIISAEKGQKPFISKPSSNIQFNVSHSGDWVLIAFANTPVGIDIEKINPEFSYKELLQDHFSEAEQTFISEAADPVSAFYYLWTCKEALTKCWGTGLQENLKPVNVLDLHSIIEMNNKSWQLKSFNISADYPAAIAYPFESENIIFFKL
jgi:4'-phosphopantetheinyl transferase